jgi:hypothetical protein
MKFFITGIRRGLGKALYDLCDTTVDSLEECDVFINCKHDGFEQVFLLYKAAELNKKIINIGSMSSVGILNRSRNLYAVEKSALDKANEQLYYQGVDTTIIRFGRFDSPRVDHGTKLKMSVEYCVSVVSWVVKQPYRVKELTVGPPVVR